MVSLIVGSLGRVGELRRLLGSLAGQTYREFEVVLVDQTGTEALAPVVAGFPGLAVRRVAAAPGLSRARNLGLSLARGEIVGFPDDDCWYPPGLLAEVAGRLAAPGVDGVSFRVTDGAGTCSAGGWMSAGRLTMARGNVWRTAVSLRCKTVKLCRYEKKQTDEYWRTLVWVRIGKSGTYAKVDRSPCAGCVAGYDGTCRDVADFVCRASQRHSLCRINIVCIASGTFHASCRHDART